MRTLFVNILVVLSIVLQSIAPVVSATESHQVDVAHLKTEHSHDQDFVQVQNTQDAGDHEISDCHHCGHCSGSHLSWVFLKNVINPWASTSTNPELFLSPPPIARKEATLRPPIA